VSGETFGAVGPGVDPDGPARETAPAHGTARPGPRPAGQGTFWEGRSALVMPGIIAVYSLYLLIGVLLMDTGDAEFPGPAFYPTLVAVAGLVLAVLLAVQVLRVPEKVVDHSGRSWRFHSDFASLAWSVGGFLAFALLLPWLGWILAGALVFWTTAHAFGSKRPLFDIVVALFVSSLAYLAFDVGLGLNLPSGILGGGF
jgi:putative tricarboxylic transport membrane protein